jgi:hypothetical protein
MADGRRIQSGAMALAHVKNEAPLLAGKGRALGALTKTFKESREENDHRAAALRRFRRINRRLRQVAGRVSRNATLANDAARQIFDKRSTNPVSELREVEFGESCYVDPFGGFL